MFGYFLLHALSLLTHTHFPFSSFLFSSLCFTSTTSTITNNDSYIKPLNFSHHFQSCYTLSRFVDSISPF
ncbi:hypothetical protein P8452_58749 [Trifolium repens]|nr:hypothetical protein P8452_58749 [Trifolium repens]